MTGPKLNEAPVRMRKGKQRGPVGESTKATAKYLSISAKKVRPVLNLIRGLGVADAADTLRLCERDAATTIGKVLRSAVANAVENDEAVADELYVSACFCDEGTTIKRWRPRARGRITRRRHRTSHITVVVSPMPVAQREVARGRVAEAQQSRARRIAASRASAEQQVTTARRSASGTTESVAGATLDTAVDDETLTTTDATTTDATTTDSGATLLASTADTGSTVFAAASETTESLVDNSETDDTDATIVSAPAAESTDTEKQS